MLEALRHAARPGPRPATGDRRPATNSVVDAAIYQALKGPFLLGILYRKRQEDQPREPVVAPHGLLLGVRRYLVARGTAKNVEARLQHYRVEEIYDAGVLPESFELDSGFSIRRHAERGFGPFEGRKEYGEIIWRFRPDAAEQARRFVFHPTQSVTDLDDGSLEVRFHASGHLEMCWHVYTWGDPLEVVAPPRLRQMVEHHRRTDFAALP